MSLGVIINYCVKFFLVQILLIILVTKIGWKKIGAWTPSRVSD